MRVPRLRRRESEVGHTDVGPFKLGRAPIPGFTLENATTLPRSCSSRTAGLRSRAMRPSASRCMAGSNGACRNSVAPARLAYRKVYLRKYLLGNIFGVIFLPHDTVNYGEYLGLVAFHNLAKCGLFTVLGACGFVLLWTMFLTEAGVVRMSEAAASLVRDGLLISLVVNGIFLYRKRHPFGAVVAAVEQASHELGLLSEVLCRVEKEQFQAPLLAELRASLDAEGAPPSRQLARLKRLMEYLDSRDNVFVRVLEIFILWTPHLALKVEEKSVASQAVL